MRPTAKLGEYKGVEVGKREPAADEEAVEAELDALRERSARLETVDEPRGRERLRRHGLPRHARRRAVRGRRGPRPAHRARLGPAHPRLRGAAHRREGGRGAHRRRSRSPTTTAPSTSGREAEFAVTVKEVKRKELPELDDDFASDAAGFDTLDELREDIAAKLREADESARRGRVPRGRARRRRRRGDGRGARGARRGARPRAVGAHAPLARPPGHLARDLPADRGQDRGGDPRRGQARRRAGAAPRGRDRRGRRGRGHRAHRRRRARRAAGVGRARGHDAGEAARPPREGRPPRRAARGPRRSARRSTCSSRTREPLTVEQARARDKLWTPDKESRGGSKSRSGPPVRNDPAASRARCPRTAEVRKKAVGRLSEPSPTRSRIAGRNPDRRAKQSEDHEPTCPHGGRADVARRARLRHLQPPAQRAHHLPGDARGRPDREPDRGAAAAPRVRGSRQGHLALHQLARRVGVRGPRDLRHDAVHQARRADDLRRHRDVDGRAAAGRRRGGQAHGAARTRRSSSTRSAPASRARRRTSRSTPRRSSTSASAWTRSSPSTPGRTTTRSATTPSATTSCPPKRPRSTASSTG